MNWKEENGSLQKEFTFDTFPHAIDFVNKVAEVAEKLQHHPSIQIDYTKVTLTLTTHDAGNIVTEKDRGLAIEIDTL